MTKGFHSKHTGAAGTLLRAISLALSLLLAGCLHVQLGGAVTEAELIITPLRDFDNVIERLETPTLEEVRDQIGLTRWLEIPDKSKLIWMGNVVVDQSLYDPDTLYLITVSGGFDRDVDTDNNVDETPTEVFGQWHAIVTGDQLTRGKITPLTEAIYRYLELNLDTLTDEEVLAEMDELARTMVADINVSGAVDYEDVLAWHRHINPNTYVRDISFVDELAEAIRSNAPAATIRSLSLDVVGLDIDNEGPFTVSGVVTIPPSTRVDSDVNDTNTEAFSNNSIESAQPLDNPVVLGGYVAQQPGLGDIDGRFFNSTDIDDYYRLNLLNDQRITLLISEDVDFNDLDLYLYRADGSLEDASLGLSELEQLIVPADGEYFVRVRAFSGASNYQLTVGIGSETVNSEHLKVSDDFVPGQIIARFRDRPRVSTLPRRARFTGMRIRGGGLGRANLLDMDQDQGQALKQRKLRTLLAMKRLRRKPEVQAASLNYYVHPTTVEPNDPFYNTQRWHYEQINLPLAWERNLGDNAIVAVIDTGIRRNHPDLIGQLVQGWDFFDSGPGDPGDSNPEDPGDSDDGLPSSFHGTHVAGTVAAASNNGRGVAGVAWNAKIMPIRVLGPGGGTNYDVLQGVRYAAGLANDSGTVPAQPADVINLSLAGGGFSPVDADVYRQVAERGVIVVAAAGNDSSSQLAYPASYDSVISVAATNINQQRAPYSNFGSSIDVAAPGGDGSTSDVNGDGAADLILSTAADDAGGPIQDNYRQLQGTSMASPHVAGVMALMKSVYPDLTTADVEALLSQGLITDDLGTTGFDRTFGWGLINANKAVLIAESLAAGGDIELIPAVTTSTGSLNFGTFADVLPLSIINGGTGVLEVFDVVSADSWLTVTPVEVNDNGVGSYNVRVDRSQLPVGTYSSGINILTNDRDVTVQVIVQQPDPNALTEGNAGTHYILLVNIDAPGDPELSREFIVEAVEGRYAFTFTDVAPGRYQLFGGSDIDNDFFICDPGESCGAWPVLDTDQPIIEVIQDLEGLDFSSTFNSGIISISSGDPATAPRFRGIRRSGYQGKAAAGETGASPKPPSTGEMEP